MSVAVRAGFALREEDETVDLRSLCGHVAVDAEVLARGYRFVPMPGSELPPFLVRRVQAGSRPVAITLLAGIDPETGEAVAEDADDVLELARRLAVGRGGLWTMRLSVGARTLTVDELIDEVIVQDPLSAAALVSELSALRPLSRSSCPCCRDA